MKWANHLDAAKHTTAIITTAFLLIAEAALCLVAAKIPSKATEAICSVISSALRPLYAALQLLQFTTWDQYLCHIDSSS